MESLPKEILIEIFGYLNKDELCTIGCVSKDWQSLVNKFTWKDNCRKRWKRPLCDVEQYGNNWKRMCLDDNMKNKALQWKFDNSRCGPGVKLINDHTITFDESESVGPSQVLCENQCIENERYYFEVIILNTKGRSINIGITSQSTNLHRRCGTDDQGWSYSLFSGTVYHNGNWTPYGPAGGTGTRVGVAIDLSKNSVFFFINNKRYGDIVVDKKEFPKNLYLSVSLGQSEDKIQIVRNPRIPSF